MTITISKTSCAAAMSAVLMAGAAALGCSDDEDPAAPGGTAGGGASGGATTGGSGGVGGAGASGGAGGAEGGAGPGELSVLETFDPALGELPEGIAIRGGQAFVGLAPTGQVRALDLMGGGEPAPFTDLPPLPPGAAFMTGVAFDGEGALFVALASFTTDPPAGVYRAPASGGPATLFASDPGLVFPNGLAFDGEGALFVTDSATGSVLRVADDGSVESWLSDPLLTGDPTACGGSPEDLTIGANGIVVTPDAAFVTNSNHGSIVRVPILAGGTAGTAEIFAGPDCDALLGADGLVLHGDDLYVAVNALDRVVRVDSAGNVTTVIDDPLLDFPASLAIAEVDGEPSLLITNFALANAMAGLPANPAVLAWRLP